MTKLSKSKCGKMMLCFSRKIVSELLCVLHATSKLCTATIAAKLMPRALRKVTLFFVGSSP